MADYSIVGKPVDRRDAVQKVTGRALHVGNMEPPGLLHVAVLRSPHPHARIVGIDVPRFKLVAFVMGTTVAGLAGSLYAHQIKIILAPDFGFIQSITFLSIVVFGGVGSVVGVTLAAIVLTLLPLRLQFIGDYKLLYYGGLLFLMMRFAPEGLAGIARAIGAKRRSVRAPPADGPKREGAKA